jgi:predicted acylesterase/phospholipase RssA
MQLPNESSARPNCDSEPITLMLVGGGIRFPAFIGVLQAIEELQLNVTKVIASSTAAIVPVRRFSPEHA